MNGIDEGWLVGSQRDIYAMEANKSIGGEDDVGELLVHLLMNDFANDDAMRRAAAEEIPAKRPALGVEWLSGGAASSSCLYFAWGWKQEIDMPWEREGLRGHGM
eukprot:CAMPEP_0117666394 /NCGR_PEP_ID=MMETSP0804-20121206/10352_1 /TAXON_ID=1074897 /ORGANISM="Tetraselmis astigmatica, Strain CCMP880" /LENGTH=103 /DNA_ID=CAMNT_0005473935 /DNA_START=476 /DNA_END=789 /DNA_ORIENTATION=+